MATNIFAYWSDELGSRAFDHHGRKGGRGICQQKMPAGSGISPIFFNVRALPGGMLASRIDLHITKQVFSLFANARGGGTLLNSKSPF